MLYEFKKAIVLEQFYILDFQKPSHLIETKQIAKHFREIHFGENWTSSNLKDNLDKVTWQQATTQV